MMRVEGHDELGETASLISLRQEIPDSARINLAQLVDILWLDCRRQLLVRNLRQIIVELCAREVVEHFFPIRFLAAIVAEIRRHLPAEEAHTRGLANPVRAEKPDDLSLFRDRETKETERVLSILVHEIFLQGFWKTDDPNCVERTFAHTVVNESS